MNSSVVQSISPLRAILVDSDHESLMYHNRVLSETGQVEICAETVSYTLALSQVERLVPDYVFCGVDGNAGEMASFIPVIRRQYPAMRIVCIGTKPDSETILTCFRLGADEFLIKPIQKETLLEMFPRLDAHRPLNSNSETHKGQLIAVWGSRGGCGTTTIACNLAYRFARYCTTILMDLHEEQGDMAVFFDLQPVYSLRDIWGRGDRIDEPLVDSVSIPIPDSTLRVLLQPQELLMEGTPSKELERLLRVLRKKHEMTVMDIGHGEGMALRVLPHLSEICLVVDQTLPSLYLASRKIRWLENNGFDKEKIRVLINSYNSRHVVSRQHIAQTLGIQNWMIVRKDDKRVLSAMNQGQPLFKISRWGKAERDIERIANRILRKIPSCEDGAPVSNAPLILRPLPVRNTIVEAQ